MLLLKLKSAIGDRNARELIIRDRLTKSGFGKPQKRQNQPIVKPARIAWIELFDLIKF